MRRLRGDLRQNRTITDYRAEFMNVSCRAGQHYRKEVGRVSPTIAFVWTHMRRPSLEAQLRRMAGGFCSRMHFDATEVHEEPS